MQTEQDLSSQENDHTDLPELHTGETSDRSFYHLTCVKQKLHLLQTKLRKERQRTLEKEITLQGQLNDALERIKYQDLALSQKAEEIKQMKQDLQRTRDESCLPHFTLNCQNTKLGEELQLDSQNMLILQAQLNEVLKHIKTQDLLMSQRAEEAAQMKQDQHRAQSQFASAETELRYERENSMQLTRNNILLKNENLKLCADLKLVQTKLDQTEECQQHKIKELQLELERNSTKHSATTRLQNGLQAERERLIAADQKVLQLQQQLKTAQHQLQVEKARVRQSRRLDSDIRELTDTLSAMRAQQHTEDMNRKLLEQRKDEFQKQVHFLRMNEACLTKTNLELHHRVHHLDILVSILQAEQNNTEEEGRDSQNSGHSLQEELLYSQLECDRLREELQQVRLQLDTHIGKFKRKQSQCETKYFRATAEMDRVTQKLEKDLMLASVLSEKDKQRIHSVMELNERLLEEKRELLYKVNEAEEMSYKSMMTTNAEQHKVNLLSIDNRQQHDQILKLSNQVSYLKRALTNTQAFYSLDNSEKVILPESLCTAQQQARQWHKKRFNCSV